MIFATLTSCLAQLEGQFGPKVVPPNVSSARSALGYDKYEHKRPESSQRSVSSFGSNWEQFGVPEIHYNFGGKNV